MIVKLDEELPEKIDCKNLVLSFKWKDDLETYVNFDRIKDADTADYNIYDKLSFCKLETRKIKIKKTLFSSITYTQSYNKELYSKICFEDKEANANLILQNFQKLKEIYNCELKKD